ncbi:MAG: patatin-like phospholipase family protein [Bacteroidales bacterium]|nr:patatin-like phospholipase family protein [Bacteroidales bacterium]
MRFRTLIVTLAALLSFSMAAFSQSLEEIKGAALGDATVSPELDAQYLQEYRDQLAKIHAKRPTVALVLSGGGAKGAAHVGVIRHLEEVGIPVDVVIGTSMGGLVGGFYAMGYDVNYLDSLVRAIDWDVALSDAVPRDYRSYNYLEYKQRYALSFPFFYPKDIYRDNVQQDMKYINDAARHSDIHFGADGKEGSNPSALVSSNLSSSLPAGYIFGQNVGNILSSLTVGYQDRLKFKDLPIPFICVATDMVSGKTKVWYEGNIVTALRSTMSIPGLFSPVRTDGYVLVDGGLRDNYPCDLAKALGVDYVIGVDLSTGYKDYSNIKNLADVISQGVDMLGRESYEANSLIPDIAIKPDMTGYSMLSFSHENIDTIVSRGYSASVAQKELLQALKANIGDAVTTRNGYTATDLTNSKIRISSVRIDGVSDNDFRYLLRRIEPLLDYRVGKKEIEDAVATIVGTDAFDYVSYSLEGTEEPYDLVIDCKRGPVNQVGVGLRMDTEEIVALLVNGGLQVHKLSGASLDFTARVSVNPYVNLVGSYSSPNGMTINLAVNSRYVDKNRFGLGDALYKMAYWNNRQELYLSNIRWSKFDVKIGLRNDIWKLRSVMADHTQGDYNFDDLGHNYQGAFMKLRTSTLDDWYYPTKGFTMCLEASTMFEDLLKSAKSITSVQFDGRYAINLSDAYCLIPSYNMRFLIGPNVPLSFSNLIGGHMPGRYLDQQIPFVGINYGMAMDKLLTTARLDFRARLYKNSYITATANYAATAEGFYDNVKLYNFRWYQGYGIEYAYNTVVGPFTANLHWSNATKRVGLYVGFGLNF